MIIITCGDKTYTTHELVLDPEMPFLAFADLGIDVCSFEKHGLRIESVEDVAPSLGAYVGAKEKYKGLRVPIEVHGSIVKAQIRGVWNTFPATDWDVLC
jgi:hypothetical protein